MPVRTKLSFDSFNRGISDRDFAILKNAVERSGDFGIPDAEFRCTVTVALSFAQIGSETGRGVEGFERRKVLNCEVMRHERDPKFLDFLSSRGYLSCCTALGYAGASLPPSSIDTDEKLAARRAFFWPGLRIPAEGERSLRSLRKWFCLLWKPFPSLVFITLMPNVRVALQALP